jgi:hypothetical protein
MDHISKSLKKYSKIQDKSGELADIKNKIIKATGIEPESVRIKNNTLYIKAKNNYEAVEMRHQSERLKNILDYKSIKFFN